MEGNGSYVTRAELNAHLQPVKDQVREIGSDVKLLLGAHIADVELAKKEERNRVKRFSKMGIMVGVFGASWWINDLVQHLYPHHP